MDLDARFNKGLINSCQVDISKHCSDVVVDDDDDKDSDDDATMKKDDDGKIRIRLVRFEYHIDLDDGKDDDANVSDGGDTRDRDMGGRVIQCLRSKYADSAVTLDSQCVTELIDVIQTSKLDVKLDLKLYKSCKRELTNECTGIDQEDCLKLLYQKGKLQDNECREQVRRIIKEGQADIHVDRALAFACQTDVLKYCNDIPIGKSIREQRSLECM